MALVVLRWLSGRVAAAWAERQPNATCADITALIRVWAAYSI
jgi:hypothetical protein